MTNPDSPNAASSHESHRTAGTGLSMPLKLSLSTVQGFEYKTGDGARRGNHLGSGHNAQHYTCRTHGKLSLSQDETLESSLRHSSRLVSRDPRKVIPWISERMKAGHLLREPSPNRVGITVP